MQGCSQLLLPIGTCCTTRPLVLRSISIRLARKAGPRARCLVSVLSLVFIIMGNQEQRRMLNKEDREMEKEEKHNGECHTEEKESEYSETNHKNGELLLEKELEGVSKTNHKVDVIKLLKELKLKQKPQQLPLLNQEEEPIQKLQISSNNQNVQNKPIVPPSLQQKANHEEVTLLKKEQRQEKQVYKRKNNENQEDVDCKQQSPAKELLTTVTFCNKFSMDLKSQTIELSQSSSKAVQNGLYFENQKLVLSSPLMTNSARASFRVQNLKYCIGMGLALKEVIQGHEFNYKSYANELSHGLYIVTSQGYSWSHHLKEEDDILHEGFNKLKNGDIVNVFFDAGQVKFQLKEFKFILSIPSHIVQKYTLCFCAYLHEKGDSLCLVPMIPFVQ